MYLERTEDLFRKMEADSDNAILYRNQIVELNLRLVAHVLKKYRPYTDDQYQAGCLGLIAAVDTYDPSRGVPFSSYACFSIEREIHKQHRVYTGSIEGILADNFVFLDAVVTLPGGDTVSNRDLIADLQAEDDFDQILEDYALQNFFDSIVIPVIDGIVAKTRKQAVKVDIDMWRMLELRYLLELADIDSQKVRFNLSEMARSLGLSVQNVRNRHIKVLDEIKKVIARKGYFND